MRKKKKELKQKEGKNNKRKKNPKKFITNLNKKKSM